MLAARHEKEGTMHTSMRSILLAAAAALAAVLVAGAFAVTAGADAGAPWGPETPNFNLEVILRPPSGAGSGFGHVKFRQPNDGDKIVYLDTWVRDLAPQHSYLLQRAVDAPNAVDGSCTNGAWLDLGAISTDDRGTGSAALFRNLPASVGTSFDIHFRVVDAGTLTPMLESGCYQFTVSL
jgi:hypothetical protein